MLFKVVTVAILAAVVSPVAAFSQSMAQIGGPAESPPAGYKGLQYVDSRGCVFMRVESSGSARWYPRVNAAHKPVCNKPRPAASIDVAEETPAPAPKVMAAPAPKAPVVVAQARPVILTPAKAPMETVASKMMPAAPAPRVVAAPVAVARVTVPVVADKRYEKVATKGPAAGQIGCYTSAPVAEVVKLRNGGTAVVCTRGDGTTSGWMAPIYPAGSRPGIALRDAPQVTQTQSNSNRVAAARSYASAEPEIVVPKGYKQAWKDGRLNPKRGVGTAQGQLAQDQIWTRKVPARLVSDVAKAKLKAKSSTVTISSMNSATAAAPAPKAAGARYVQIGTFGVASNAAGAASRLQVLGLPVAKSKLTKGGKVLQIVMVGPFGSSNDAQSALQMARRAGFGDAFLR